MRWLDICETDKDELRSYENFLGDEGYEVLELPPELAKPFPHTVHICGIDTIAELAPLTSPWIIARRMVEHAHLAATDPDPDQTIQLNGILTLLYTIPVTPTTWAACALQSYWNDWDDAPAHAIYAQHWGLRDTPVLPPRDPDELWANRAQPS